MRGTPFILVAAIVFAANAGLLILQLLATRFLAPFIGSSLETWTAVIGVFLLGIALGNGFGGRLADKHPHPRRLALLLFLGALATAWMIGLPRLLDVTGLHRNLSLGWRVPALALLECFPAGFTLSLITPLAIRLLLPDLSKAGRIAGIVFSLGTLGCLLGNYATGFLLIPHFAISTIAGLVAGAFALLAVVVLAVSPPSDAVAAPAESQPVTPVLSMRLACSIVFACSFCGMALELAASRLLSCVVGVSLYSWTGIIGVILAGTAAGNWLGGQLADRGGPRTLTLSLLAAGAAILAAVLGYFLLDMIDPFKNLDLVPKIIGWTFALFFLPMLLLGTISPQVIRLAVSDLTTVGRTAGRVYAWSTAGAIAGTFAAGYLLISTIGMYRTVTVAAGCVLLVSGLVPLAWERRSSFLTVAALLGLALAALIVIGPGFSRVTMETNYFTIRVQTPPDDPGALDLCLDRLVHSRVRIADPTYTYYPHEQLQLAALKQAEAERTRPVNVLVIGGGGYTMPRAAGTLHPRAVIDVVEIDPGVTAVSYSHLGLDPKLGIRSFHMDGRQFLAERAAAEGYDLITLDAVNDLSVPWHLLTRECNASARRALAPGGVYLLTVIDNPAHGGLWKASVATLRQTFAHVETLSVGEPWLAEKTKVQIIYASDRPLDLAALRKANAEIHVADKAEVEKLIAAAIVLTDEYAPVDNLMAPLLRDRR